MQPSIVRIPILPMHMLNAYLLMGDHGCVLFDTGLPGSRAKIAAQLQRYGRGWEDIKLIVISHAHIDHAGSMVAVRKQTQAPIVAHALDVAALEGQRQTFVPTGWLGRLLLNNYVPVLEKPYPPYTPELQMQGDDEFSLAPYGVAGRLLHTPGHTPGSLSLLLDDGRVLVADLIASGVLLGGVILRRRAKRPPAEADPGAAGRSLLRLLDAGGQEFYMSHGWTFGREPVRRHAERLLKLAAAQPDPEYAAAR